MALYFETQTPNGLLKAFKKAIDDGHISTWSYDSQGDFTHTPEQWNKLAWFRPKVIEKKQLVFSIIRPKNRNISSEVYAVYHGRFLESILVHCDTLFTKSIATALPAETDNVAPSAR